MEEMIMSYSCLVHICINVYDLIPCSTVVSFSIQQNNPDLNMCLGFLPHSTQTDITSSVSICSRSGRNETCFSRSLLSTSSHTFDHYTSLLQTGKKRQEVAWQVRTNLIWCVTPRAEKVERTTWNWRKQLKVAAEKQLFDVGFMFLSIPQVTTQSWCLQEQLFTSVCSVLNCDTHEHKRPCHDKNSNLWSLHPLCNGAAEDAVNRCGMCDGDWPPRSASTWRNTP